MKKLTLFAAAIIISLLSSVAFAQVDFNKDTLDSVRIDDNFTFVLYEVTGTAGQFRGERAHQLVWLCDGEATMYTAAKNLKVHQFVDPKDKEKTVYAKDINGDGFKEIVILGHTGLGSCCHHLAFHTLQDTVIIDLGVFELRELNEYKLKDIDGDKIPEVIIKDPNYLKWNTQFSNSPQPTLIWKWNKNQYKAANYKFSDYLLKQITKDDIKKMEKAIKRRVEKEYDPNHDIFKYPPSELWGVILDYIYANKADKAEEILNKYWPKEIPGKEQFYADLQKKIEDGEYWDELSKSKW